MDTPGATPPVDRPRDARGETGREQRRDWPSGWHVQVVEETGSTNADLLAAASAGAPDQSVLMARHQTAGRGRLDRTWVAPPGANLLVSLLFTDVPHVPHVLTQRVGLAAQAAARQVAGVEATLKWPNDLLVGDRKLAGVLAQSTFVAGHQAVVVGIGLNVGWAPPEGACLADGRGDTLDPLDVLHALLVAFDAQPADIAAEYRANLGTLGRSVRVELADGVLEGRAIDVEPGGRLVVLDACGMSHRLDTGDVVHLRAQG